MSSVAKAFKHGKQYLIRSTSMLAIAIMFGFIAAVAALNFIDFGRID
ncbi:MAG: hypothetical protein AAGC58_13340 [Asticcacaulis sp.]|nr:hypothetical protein [Asticcacaulis tiandongensis]